MPNPKQHSDRTLLGLRVTVAGKLALIEAALSRVGSTSASPRVDIPRSWTRAHMDQMEQARIEARMLAAKEAES